ncbi:hypothetical protein [Campylobacter sp. MIT 99-7217]|uniref:hypothetical protein n=1 Tax=Campylobacter sp. MIT 99-7217 TaxID=535091 RepID=UPI00115C315B|nr:hypothetical protein [Campylobacter sp. MIT 99-7217]
MSKKHKERIYHKSVNGFYISWGVFFVLYQILSSIFAFLPVLIGVFFCYMFVLLMQRNTTLYDLDFRWYFSLLYLCFIDITHNYYLFSCCIAFALFYFFCADYLRTNFKISKLIPSLFVCCAYGLVFGIDCLLSYVNNASVKSFSVEYLYYILLESLIVTIFFKDEIK